MGRYIIDNPEPPGAMEQFRGNVNRLGQTMLQVKMAEIERKRKLEGDIAQEGRKMQGELGLLREKAKMEQESPLGMLEQRSKMASYLKDTGQEATPEQMDFLGINRPRTMTETPQVDINAPLSVNTNLMKSPVFGQGQGQMIPESGTIENTPFGSRMKDVKVFSPEAEQIKQSIQPETQEAATSGSMWIDAVNNINKIKDITSNPDFKWSQAGKFAAGSGQKLLSFGNKDILELTKALNFLKLTAFGLGGKQLTPAEQKTLYRLFNPLGEMGDEGWIKDLDEVASIFESRAKLQSKNIPRMETMKQQMLTSPTFGTQGPQEFSSEAEAEAAGLQDGQEVIINGKRKKYISAR